MKQLKTYTPELREEAVRLVLAQGLTLEKAALRLATPKGTLGNWVSAAKRGNTSKAAPGSRTVPELEAEVAKLRRELAEARTSHVLGPQCRVILEQANEDLVAVRLPAPTLVGDLDGRGQAQHRVRAVGKGRPAQLVPAPLLVAGVTGRRRSEAQV